MSDFFATKEDNFEFVILNFEFYKVSLPPISGMMGLDDECFSQVE